MAVTDEVETDESEPDSNQHLCPFCGYNYAHNPASCVHLLCTVEYVESNNELVVAPDHPIVASLYGLDVPRVVAGRFTQYLRNQERRVGAFCWDSAQGVRTTDLLGERGSHSGVVSIKFEREDPDLSSFREWTYYLTAAPADSIKQFVSFVKKHYCPSTTSDVVVPFSQVHIVGDMVTLDAADVVTNEAGHWVMLTGMPDDLPLFFFSVTTPTPAQSIMLINHSTNIVNRMKHWPSLPSCVSVTPLKPLPDVVLN
jgi:hypothetical protein